MVPARQDDRLKKGAYSAEAVARRFWQLALLLCGLLLTTCGGSDSLEGLPVITSPYELDSAIILTQQVWPEDERGSYFAQFAFDPNEEPLVLRQWEINIQSQGECRTKWFDWSPQHETVRFYCGKSIYLQPVPAKEGTLLLAPEIPDAETGWILPHRNGSPDGRLLLYEVPDEIDPNSDVLMVIDTQTRQSERINLPPAVDQLTVKWAPDGQSFVTLVRYLETGDYAVLRVTRDGLRAERLAGIQLTSGSRELSWSNDGASLLYGQADDGGAALWVYDFATDSAEKIFSFSNEESDIGVHAWSPDDAKIVFVSSFATSCSANEAGVTTCGRQMHIIDRDGQNMRDLPGFGEQDDIAWVGK